MDILTSLILAIWFCLAPAGVLWLCRRIKWLDKIGPVLILYSLGIITGNVGIFPEQMKPVQDILSSAMIPLAIPLMLFGCTFRKNNTRSQILALVTGIIAVVCAVIAGYLIFGKHIDEGQKVGGMLTGVYTGGTINLAALKAMLGTSDEVYILMNSYDMIVSFLYLTFLLAVGIRLFRKFLPYGTAVEKGVRPEMSGTGGITGRQVNPYARIFTKKGMKEAGILIGITLAICAVSGGIAFLFPEDIFMVVFILSLTTAGIACSFNRKIRSMESGYDIGMYFIYIFCITVASMADLTRLDLAGGMYLLGYLLFVVFGSLAVQALLARLFRIDADTMVIASVTFINSPPFVPMIAAAMKNRDVIPAGLSIGIIGYAIGNYLGFAIYSFLGTL